MLVTDLEGVDSEWKLTGYSFSSRQKRSSYHIKARKLIKDIFPTLQILEEVSVRLRQRDTAYLDFYVPVQKLAVEVHGEQHYNFISFYHQTTMGFLLHQKRDREKQRWCELNDITLIELPFDKQEEWRNMLL